jgi:glutamine synthetase
MANEKTARIEIRSVAPDANPYLVFYTILKTGNEGKELKKNEEKRPRLRFLPDNINDAIRLFKTSDYITEILGEKNKNKYLDFKQAVADRSPKALGTLIKDSEILYHHEVQNQVLWNMF